MKPSLYYPVRPFHVNQNFADNIPCVKDYGLPTQSIVSGPDNATCPAGYRKLYAVFGMNGHDGTDLQAGEQDVYSASDGIVVEKQTIESRGLGLGIVTPTPLDLGVNGVHYLKLRYWHLKSFAVEVGAIIKAGDLIGVSDNTGYSSGNHLHFEGDPMDKKPDGTYVPSFPNNGFAGAIDIAPYFNGIYADVVAQETTLYLTLKSTLQALLALLERSKT